MKQSITFITGNQHKADQLSKYLGIPIAHQKIELDEIQSMDLKEIVAHKLKEAYKHLESPVIVDDVSLSFDALNGLPGPFTKFFENQLGLDGMCKLMSHYDDKSTQTTVAIGYYDGEHIEIFTGTVEGTVSDSPQGNGGFGFDPILIPNGYSQTRAEMNETDYDATSPRKFALEKLERYLKSM